MKSKLFKDKNDGKWKANFKIKEDQFDYLGSLICYLNVLDPFFTRAKKKSEFSFILTLLRFDGAKDAGWDPFENLSHVYEAFKMLSLKKVEGNMLDHYALFLYGLILEASAPYELIANLINILEGDTYKIKNFPDYTDSTSGRQRSLSPADKISQLRSRAKKQKLELSFYDDFFDYKLRNAIFHSDYVIYSSEIRINNPAKKYSKKEWMILVNKTFAYIEALLHLYNGSIADYKSPQLIDPNSEYNYYPGAKMTTVVREDYGLIGIKDIWTKKELEKGMIPNHLGRFLFYEQDLLEKGILHMPPNRIEVFNKKIKHLPSFVRKYLVKKFKKKYNFI